MRVFHFSGGRSSAYMLLTNYRPGDIVIFCDTEREAQGTYDFIDNVEKYEGIPIIRLKFKGGWKELLRQRKAIPNQQKKFCTLELKILTARRYLWGNNIKSYTQYIGYRADEKNKNRVKDYRNKWKKVSTLFPMYTQGVTKADVLAFWQNKPYDLDIPPILGNCDLCFMKGQAAVIAIMQDYPELADKWIQDEKENAKGNTYFNGVTMEKLLERSKRLMKQYNLFDIQPAFNCSCDAG